jgi:6,7-dimethyl-8-ribityllumazine synthase
VIFHSSAKAYVVKTVQGHLYAGELRFGIVVSRFNSLVTERLLSGAVDCLTRHGASPESIIAVYCPGAFEIPYVARRLAGSGQCDAVVCLGCVIRGDTPHFDYVAAEVSKGIGQLLSTGDIPISFGILTTDTLEQALERAGAKAGNKGWDAALSAIELAHLTQQLSHMKGTSRG